MFKKIPGYKNYYASKCGKIARKLKNGEFSILTPRFNSRGYFKVALHKNDEIREELVHRLICRTFKRIGKVRKIVNHINNLKTDNRIENLEFCTQSENLQHYYKKFYNKK